MGELFGILAIIVVVARIEVWLWDRRIVRRSLPPFIYYGEILPPEPRSQPVRRISGKPESTQ